MTARVEISCRRRSFLDLVVATPTEALSDPHCTEPMLFLIVLTAEALVQPSFNTDRRSAVIGAAAAATFITNSGFSASAANVKGNPVPTAWTLPNGVLMPTLALNTAGMTAAGSERATMEALDAGIKHVDFHPGIERDGVAKALKAAGKERASELFLTTKIKKPPKGTAPADAAELVFKQIKEDFKALNVNNVDMLMLRDSPDPAVMQAQWGAMEASLETGLTRSIGVINYCEGSLKTILETAKTPPALNYIMQHVGMGKDALGLRAFGESKGIKTFAYGAVGEPGPSDELLSSPVLQKIAKAKNRSVEEVALRWVLQGGCAVSVRPTLDFGLGVSACGSDACRDGLMARAQAFDWSLSASEMKSLDKLTSPGGNPTLFSTSACPNSFFG